MYPPYKKPRNSTHSLPPPPPPPNFSHGFHPNQNFARGPPAYSSNYAFPPAPDFPRGNQTDTYPPHKKPRDSYNNHISPGEIIDLSDEEEEEEKEEDAHSEEGDPVDEEHKEIQEKLNAAMGLKKNQVPEYILRMRQMGPCGYPPALIDGHVRVCDITPFFGGSSDQVLPKRCILREKLPAFRGYTHLSGNQVSEEFLNFMNAVADVDHTASSEDALNRSGIKKLNENTYDESSILTLEKSTDVVRFEVPDYDISLSSDYLFADETGSMKHNLSSFSDGIQPFEKSEVSKPSFFMSKLRNILQKKPTLEDIH